MSKSSSRSNSNIGTVEKKNNSMDQEIKKGRVFVVVFPWNHNFALNVWSMCRNLLLRVILPSGFSLFFFYRPWACVYVCEHVSLFNHFELFLFNSFFFSGIELFLRQFNEMLPRLYIYVSWDAAFTTIWKGELRRRENTTTTMENENLVFNRNICFASILEYLIHSMRISFFSLFLSSARWISLKSNGSLIYKCWYFQYFCCYFGFSYILQILFDTLCLYKNVFMAHKI